MVCLHNHAERFLRLLISLLLLPCLSIAVFSPPVTGVRRGWPNPPEPSVQFLQRSLCKRCIYYGKSVRLPVCLSVRLSVTLRYCVKTSEHRGMRSSLSGSSVSLVFWRQESPVQVKFECKEVNPSEGCECHTRCAVQYALADLLLLYLH